MSPNARSPVSELTIPGKVFLLGEYAVLADEPALILAAGPRFAMRVGPAAGVVDRPHPDSPAGRLADWVRRERLPGLALEFVDPHGGAGGFGASTARFAMAYFAHLSAAGLEPSARGARKLYRELHADQALPPSGADLAAQWTGGLVRFDPREGVADRLTSDADLGRLLIFSASAQAGRKVATHEHLAALAAGGFPRPADREWAGRLRAIVARGARALTNGLEGTEGLGAALDDYADHLAAAGFEAPATRADRAALRALPGVEGCKGTGALQADAVIAWLAADASPAMRLAVVHAARARGLHWLEDGQAPGAGEGIACS